MLPGVPYEGAIQLKNVGEKEANFYMDTEVVSTLLGVDNVKDTSYRVSLSVGDNVLVGYDAESDAVTGTIVGGEGTTGLEELNMTLPEYPLVATLKPGETADVVLTIQPDAEETDNTYISSLGRVEFRFKVSDVSDSVITGDNYVMYISIAVIVVGLILFFVLAAAKRNRRKDNRASLHTNFLAAGRFFQRPVCAFNRSLTGHTKNTCGCRKSNTGKKLPGLFAAGGRQNAKKTEAEESLPVRIARGVILAVVLCAAVVLVLRLLEYKQGADVYGQLQAEMGVVSGGESQTGDSEDGEEKEPPLLDIDFERLWSENQEVSGLAGIPGAAYQYPIMHTDNNDYYLSHLWNGQPNSSGSIFLDANNKSVDDLYTVVYGHNMYDGSMFGLFNRYESSEFCEENGAYFRVYTPDAVWKYEIFTSAKVPYDDPLYTVGYTQGELYNKLLDRLASSTMYDTGYHVQHGDTVMTLSTCTGSDTVRRILCGRRSEKLK